MIDIEFFSLLAWATPNCLVFNMRKSRGIAYRGSWIADSESIPETRTHAEPEPFHAYDRFTYGT